MDVQDVFREYAGEKVYIRKRPAIDWGMVAKRHVNGESLNTLAKSLGVSRSTVIRRLKTKAR